MEYLTMLLQNNVFLATGLAWALSQAIKSGIHISKGTKASWKLLFEGGGMPSSHTSTVVSLCLSVFYVEGLSTLSVVVLFLAIIVVRDVMGIHLNVNKPTKIELDKFGKHNPLEVLVGGLVGIAMFVAVFLF